MIIEFRPRILAMLAGPLVVAMGCAGDADTGHLPTVQLTAVFGESGIVEFGGIGDIAMLGDRSIVVLDGMNERIIVLDPSTGAPTASWGDEGQGPREFRSIRGIWAADGGEIGVVDVGNRRVSFWTSDGRFERAEPFDLLPWAVVSRGGAAYLKAGAMRGQGLGFYEIAPDGSVAETPAVAFPAAAEGVISCRFCPAAAIGNDRFLVGGEGTDYRVSVIDSTGIVEQWTRDLDPVRRDSATIRRMREALAPAAAMAGTTPNVTEYKPWFPRHAFGIDATGRIWVLRAAEGEERSSFDLFAPGRNKPVGTIRVPRQDELLGMRMFGRTILAYGRNPAGIPVVLEYEVREVP